MSFRKNTWNRTLNTVGIVPRTAGTGLHAVGDATKTALYGVLDAVEGVGKTATDIKTAVSNACKNGPRYHRLRKAPVSILTSPIMAIEGVAETLRYTGGNILRNARNTIAHPFINFGHGIKRMGSSQSARNFSFAKTDVKGVTPKSYLAKLFR